MSDYNTGLEKLRSYADQEVYGRITPEEAQALIDALIDRARLRDENGGLREALAWALESLGDPPDFTGLWDDYYRAREALAASQPQGAPGLTHEERNQ